MSHALAQIRIGGDAACDNDFFRTRVDRGTQCRVRHHVDRPVLEGLGDVGSDDLLSLLLGGVDIVDDRRFESAVRKVIALFVFERHGQPHAVLALFGELLYLGSARIFQPEHARDLVERLTRGVVLRRPQQLDLVKSRHLCDRGMTAARDQANVRRFEVGKREVVGGDVSLDVIDRNQRLVQRVRERLCERHSYEQRPQKSRTVRHRHAVEFVRPHARIGERFGHDARYRHDVIARRDLGDDAAVAFVDVDLRRDHVGEDLSAARDRARGLVARRLDREYEQVVPAPHRLDLFARTLVPTAHITPWTSSKSRR